MRPLESLFFIALALYTTAIWADRLKGELKPWMVLVFGLAVTSDTLGTVLLCAAVNDAFRINVHTVTGTASLLIMLVHFFWAWKAFWRVDDKRIEMRFRRWSPWAWSLWLVSFLSGAFFH